jgi:hypothetical protein
MSGKLSVIGLCVAMTSSLSLAAQKFIPAGWPNDSAIAAVMNDLNKGDEASVQQAIEQMQYWVQKRNVTPMPLWRQWLPTLMNYHRYQAVVDLTVPAIAARPGIAAIEPLLEFRVRALLALHKPKQALAAAKSYYNVCALKDTSTALDLIAQCLDADHSSAGQQAALRFRGGQLMAADAGAGTGAAPASPILKSITVEPHLFDAAIQAQSVGGSFADRVGYGNLLLAAGQCDKAEREFRDLYRDASTQSELTQATEGIARSLRAEDGTTARATAWLLTLRQARAQ